MKTKAKTQKKTSFNKEILSRYRLLEDFMNGIPDVVYFKDTKGRLILVNRAHAKGLGLRPEQVVGKTDFDIFPKKRAELMFKDDQQVIKTGKPIIDKVERATRPDGVDNYVSTTKIPRYDQKGKVIGLIGITRDVTRRMQFERLREEKVRIEKKLEMLEEMNQLKSEFISTISHELRTPLAIIKQLMTLLYDGTAGPINAKQKEVLVKSRHNIERLKITIDHLLDISRIENKKLSLRYSLVNLNDLLKESQEFFKESAREKNIELKYNLPKGDVILFIDAERMIQIMTNLINNAIKFTEENGTITIDVKVLETKVRVGVIDSGVGIAKADLPKVFGKFVQLSPASSAGKKGIGLGLSIVKELVEKHGGEIWIESETGVGSKFYFTIPRFYTANVLGKGIKEKINKLLDKNERVHLINLLIVNYEEFQKRVDIAPPKLFTDLKNIINSSFKEYFRRDQEAQQVFITDMHQGKYSIIFPEVTSKKVAAYCEMLRERTKSYFSKNKIENVFIALGVLSYSTKTQTAADDQAPANLNIKEIYIGSEIRRFKRIKYKTDIELALPDGKKHLFKTIDISQGGVCFEGTIPLKTDLKVKMKMALLDKKGTISAETRVAWISKIDRQPTDTEDKYKIGLEFIMLAGKDKNLLSKELKLYYE